MITVDNTLEVEVVSPYKIVKDVLFIKNTDLDALYELSELLLAFEYIKFILKDREMVYKCSDISVQIDGAYAVVRDLEEVIKQWEQ